MTHGPRLTPLAQSLPATVPFVGPETQERLQGFEFKARLGANENVFGPSPKAVEAMAKAASDIWMYGDPESHDLRHALAAHHGVKPENIMVGEGIDGLLGYLARLVVGPGDKVVTSDGAYPTFNYHVAGFGGELVKLPYKDDAEDLPALLEKAAEVDAKLVYFANPDNPMASWVAGEEIEAQLDNISEGTVLILDEAYVEFAPADAVPNIDIDDPRVIRMRTFSKAYGMAGARVGYAMGAPELINAFNKIRNHFGMNRAAQEGALVALADQQYLAENIANVAAARDEITRIAADNGLTALPSATNFVTIDCGGDGTFAKSVLDGLVARGVFVRMPFAAPGNRCIRLSCGPTGLLTHFADALPKALAEARA
ncbi:pyridoxal phosphate-dependent aminotransferase [Alisedimentitalea sp. MJ-SS2]|uniref:pyridoxal phosphate-dependent aminotransferase n=1 Tax=Aliisedimentitalea sp. MJ-SS2 TaxID=3049795 RepID=UPI00290D6D38|nr:pyridoxal phosphate-dependent aminotransferase [Alisedimentitalea sp. MJ-SS2]MDU8928409.1 pyridoxal phosphate-dependent aminotransferase [Alisedimentitalea sp. MJ-SS2]